MARCRLQHSEGAPRRPPHSSHIGVCDIREAAGRERAASTAGNRPLFYFRFGERTFLREKPHGGTRLKCTVTQRHCRHNCRASCRDPGVPCLRPDLRTSSQELRGAPALLDQSCRRPQNCCHPTGLVPVLSIFSENRICCFHSPIFPAGAPLKNT